MNEFLAQAFGESGPMIAQVAVAAGVVLAALAVFYFVARRYAQGRPGAVHGRVPRLAIVEALPIDNKRQLLLVRRDGIEHLILVGGPSDVLIEPSIIRPRQQPRPAQVPAASPQPAPVAAVSLAVAPLAVPAVAVDPGPPMPFPFTRVPPVRSATLAANNGAGSGAKEVRRSSAFAPSVDTFADPPGSKSGASETNGADFNPRAGDDGSPMAAASGSGHDPLAASAAHRVSALEAEMNRLLGQISADRRSS